MPALKKGPKIGLVVIAILILFFGLQFAASHGMLPSNIGKILVPTKANLGPDPTEAVVQNVKPVSFASATPAHVGSVLIRLEKWEWNAQSGEFLALGGNETMKGSIMEKYGVNAIVSRQDDNNKMIADLVVCAKEIKAGASQCSQGTNIVNIMGDGAYQFAMAANSQLTKLGKDYELKIIGAAGYSRGEDAFMTPASFKADPHSIATTEMNDKDNNPLPTKGLLVAGVILDGDWNIALNYAGSNNIPNNPDETTFDRDAINWSNSSDYIQAAKDYIGGKCEDRKEVSKGKLTGNKVHVCINSVVTWTPGDVMIAETRGGLVKTADSKMYRSQMPSIWIGSGHFLNANRHAVEQYMKASFEGANQIKAFPTSAGKQAAKISAIVYADEGGQDKNGHTYTGGEYWYKYFLPVSELDKQGLRVSLGGSAVNNLEDNKILFGLNPGSNDNMTATYSVFAAIDRQQYPDRFKGDAADALLDPKTIIDKSFLKEIIINGDDSSDNVAADITDYNKVGSEDVVSSQNVSINFATGSAQPAPDGVVTLSKLKDTLALNALKIKLDGFTDNTGNEASNKALSAARAAEVKTWLQAHAPSTFPNNRFVSTEGHGSDSPVGDNSTVAGKAANRRVTVVLTQ